MVVEGYGATAEPGKTWPSGPARVVTASPTESLAALPDEGQVAGRKTRLLPTSGKTDGALLDLSRRHVDWLDGQAGAMAMDPAAAMPMLAYMAWTAGVGHSHFSHRAGVLFDEFDSLRDALAALADKERTQRRPVSKVAFRICIETFAGLGVAAVAEAYEAGLPISFDGLFAGETRRRISLPSYPFQWRRHWVETSRRRQASAGRPLLGVRHESPRGEVMFETEMFPSDPAWLDDHRGVAAGTESFSRYLAGEGVEAHSRAVLLADLEACRNPMRLRLCSGWIGSAGLAHR